MIPSIDKALNELHIAGELYPGPWLKHSENVGLGITQGSFVWIK